MYLGYDSITVRYFPAPARLNVNLVIRSVVGVPVVWGDGVVGINNDSDGANERLNGVWQMWLIYFVHYMSIYVISYL